jgi:hypothetical protein
VICSNLLVLPEDPDPRSCARAESPLEIRAEIRTGDPGRQALELAVLGVEGAGDELVEMRFPTPCAQPPDGAVGRHQRRRIRSGNHRPRGGRILVANRWQCEEDTSGEREGERGEEGHALQCCQSVHIHPTCQVMPVNHRAGGSSPSAGAIFESGKVA